MQRILLSLTFLFACLHLAVAQQPANDTCANALSLIPDGSCYSGDNTGVTADMLMPPTSCVAGGFQAVWFTFTVPAGGGSAVIDVTAGFGNAEIGVYEATGTPCDPLGVGSTWCANGNNPQLIIDGDLTPGSTYWIALSFQNNGVGTYDICVDAPVLVANDDCSGAFPLNDINGNCNTGLTNDFSSTDYIALGCTDPAPAYSVWYSFVAQGVSISDLHIEGASGPLDVIVTQDNPIGSCTFTTFIECGINVTAANPITIDNELTIGETYYVQVSTNDIDNLGDFDLCLNNPPPAFNDDCMDAPVIPVVELSDPDNCITSIAGNPLDNDWPSTDVSTPGCWGATVSWNVWFQFVAQGPDLDVDVTADFGATANIAVVNFGGTPCMSAGATVLVCSNNGTAELDNTLTPGNTYYIMVGFSDNEVGTYCINAFNPVPPPNDMACNALLSPTDGSCNSGACPGPGDCFTTEYATLDVGQVFPGAGCGLQFQSTVWFTMNLMDPTSVGFEINLTEGTAQDAALLIGHFNNGCANLFSIDGIFCGNSLPNPIEFGPLDETLTYYIVVGTSEANEGTFSICVEEIPPCFTNNTCGDPASPAIDMGTPNSLSLSDCASSGGETFVCVEGCNLFADPEPGLTGCLGPNDPVVWYTFTSDAVANILNMQINAEYGAPSIQLFLDNGGGCPNLVGPIGLTASNTPCLIGSGGQVIANSTAIGSSSTYYIAVGGVNTAGGDFELCITTLESAASCVTSSSINVVWRSSGGDLSGPFLPGEQVNVCLNVVFTVAGGAQNCQWFQGIVPVFGNGWDTDLSFDADLQPLNATMNGNAFPAQNLHNGGQWDWWSDVTYHHPHCFYNVGDFDGNGTLDMCNGLFDPDCVVPAPGWDTGGCCSACWNTTPGNPLPPGWFTSGVTGLCGIDGHPTVDWGDGNTCSGVTGPWNFCFDLTVRSFPDCQDNQTTMDLSIGFVTFADGEVGSWNGGPSVCGQDEPTFSQLPMCCNDLVGGSDIKDPICTNGIFQHTINDPSIADFWEWTVNAGSVTGASDGSGPNGTNIIQTLTNPSNSSQIVTYTFYGYQGGECPSAIIDVEIEVFPEIDIDFSPIIACSTPTNPYEITPNVSGGSGNYTFAWNTGDNSPSIMVSNPSVGQQFIVTVTDDAGCESTESFVLDVYTTFPVNINSSALEQCASDGPIDLSANASGGQGGYNFNWTIPGGGSSTSSDISATEPGLYVVTVTDDEGCTGTSSVALDFYDSPDVSVNPGEVYVCPNDPDGALVFSLVIGGQQPYQYEWQTPIGFASTQSIFAEALGTYNLTVTDQNGCSGATSFPVLPSDLPQLDLGADYMVCPEDIVQGIEINAADPDFVFYTWQGGPQGPNATTHVINTPGTYILTVENAEGCEAEDEITISEFPGADLVMPDTIPFCTGGYATLDVGFGWADVEWEHGSTDQEVLVFNPGLFIVTVTDDNGCTDFEEIIVIETGFLQPQVTGDTSICFSGSVVLTAPPGFFFYEWQDNSDDETFTANGPGWYSVTVTDITGCTGVDSVEVHLGNPMPQITGNLSICSGESATLNVDAGYESVEWSTTETSTSIEVTSGGDYIVTVTDIYGCEATDVVTVIEGEIPEPQISGSTSFCTGFSTILDAGAGYATYEWSTMETSQTIEVDTEDDYYLTVTNAAGCIGYDTIHVDEDSALNPNINGDTSICNGVSVVLDAGSGFTDYNWSTGSTNPTTDVTTPGTVTLTVTDANGCTGTAEALVVSSAPDPIISGAPAVCQGQSSDLDAGAGWAEYQWSGGLGTGQTVSVNTTGTYTVTVTDEFGCTGTEQFAFTVNNNPTPTISGSATFCTGSSTTLSLPAGFAYTWSTGASTQMIIVSTPGTIIATVTDANGCTGTDDIVISESTSLDPNIDGPASLCTGETIVLDAGGGFETYEWGPGGETGSSIPVTAGGTYTLTVSDASGCTGTTSFVVDEFEEPFANVTPTTDVCNTMDDGSVVDFAALITGGDAGGNWTDDDGSGAGGNFPNLDFDGVPPGNYTFTYTTNSAIAPCEDQSYVVVVTVNDCACPSPEVAPANPMCNSGGTIDLTDLYLPGITEPGGTWSVINTPAGSNPATLAGVVFDVAAADAGSYTLQYTLANAPAGCPESAEVDIVVNDQPDAGVAKESLMICAGEDETVDLTTLLTGQDTGGVWVESSGMPSTGGAFDDQTGTFITTNQVPGSYTFEYVLSGVAPCVEALTTVEVIVEELPIADAGIPEELTCDNKSATLGGAGTSTGPVFSYMWTLTSGTVPTPTALNPEVTKPGEYTLEVTNTETGCISYDVVVITASSALPSGVDYGLQQPKCVGEPPLAGMIDISGVTGGTPPYQYSLNGGTLTSTPVFGDLAPGDYTLLILDSEGCEYEETFSIDTPAAVDGTIEGELLIEDGSTTLSYTFFPGVPDSTIWLLNGEVACVNCDSLVIEEPQTAGVIEVTLIMYDENGCEIILREIVAVIRNRNIFIPNVFSPNNDGFNDYFTVYTGVPRTVVESMRIFTRWGEVVFERSNFDPTDEQSGWDGRFAGKDMLPGVYVYQITLRYEHDQEVEVLKGDITLVR